MDLYNKHVKCAYPQAEKHPIFVLEHKHIVRGSNPHCGITAKTPEARYTTSSPLSRQCV